MCLRVEPRPLNIPANVGGQQPIAYVAIAVLSALCKQDSTDRCQPLAESPALHHGPPPRQTDQGKCVKHTFSSESFPCFGLTSVGHSLPCPAPSACCAVLSVHCLLSLQRRCPASREDLTAPCAALLSCPSAILYLIRSLLWCNPLKIKVLTVPRC